MNSSNDSSQTPDPQAASSAPSASSGTSGADDAASVSADAAAVESAPRAGADAAAGSEAAPSKAPGERPVFHKQPYSFVRRGDRLSPKRQKAWDEYASQWVLDIPRVMTDTSVDPSFRLDHEALFGRKAPLVVEIGSGLGEAIVNHALAHPELDHLAVEVYKPGIADLLMKASQAGVTNVRVAQANAPEVLEHMLEPGSVHELWVFFPDPWHKTRHHKRRLVGVCGGHARGPRRRLLRLRECKPRPRRDRRKPRAGLGSPLGRPHPHELRAQGHRGRADPEGPDVPPSVIIDVADDGSYVAWAATPRVIHRGGTSQGSKEPPPTPQVPLEPFCGCRRVLTSPHVRPRVLMAHELSAIYD